MINNITIAGRLTADPEIKTTANTNLAVTTFTIANDVGYGEKKKTYFITVVAWKGLAENIARFTRKGSMVIVNGQLTIRKWQDKDGNNRYATEVVANDVQFLDSKKDAAEAAEGTAPASVQHEDTFEVVKNCDDLPF